jgi:hypothetical protein
MADVISLRDTSLNDIPNMLRKWADWIEDGTETTEGTMLLVIPRQGDWPVLVGLGEHLGDLGNIATMELAKTWFVNNLTAR